MPVIVSAYQAPRLFRGGHAATLLAAFLPAPAALEQRRERLDLPDGDFLDLAWQTAGHRRLAILSHGLEGSLDAPYIRSMAHRLRAAGWDILSWNYRGCGGTPNRLLRSYHSGESGDLRHVIHYAAPRYSSIALIGFSLGGNLTLKYLGEAPPHPHISAAVAISAPVDLASSAAALDQRRSNRLYQARFLQSLLAKTRIKLQRFPGSGDPARLAQVRTIRDFDALITAPWHGFTGPDDYYAQSSAGPLLHRITVPALLLNARNDPLFGPPCFPDTTAIGSAPVHLEYPASGGHLGFPVFAPGLQRWHEIRALEFLGALPT